MALNILGLLAAALIATAEGLAPSRLGVANILFVAAIGLLVAAFHVSYFIVAIILAVLGCFGVVLYSLPAHYKETSTMQGTILGKFGPVFLAGLIHLLGIWLLPIVVVWNYSDAYSNYNFFSQEIGHVFPATFYFVILILTPLLFLPRGYYEGTLLHQSLEGITIAISGLADFVVFRVVHHFIRGDPPEISAATWDHELLALIWCAGGLVGYLTAKYGYKTSAHITFPALVICYNMMNHSHHSGDMENTWMTVWMTMHKIHALCFGLGALCRLWNRIPESLLFFFLGCVSFVFSSFEVTQWLFDELNYTKDKDSGWSPDCDPDCDVHYPTDHVAMVVVLTLGALAFPVHLALCEQLRKFTEQMAPAAFTALPTTDAVLDGETTASDYESNGGGEHAGSDAARRSKSALLNKAIPNNNGCISLNRPSQRVETGLSIL